MNGFRILLSLSLLGTLAVAEVAPVVNDAAKPVFAEARDTSYGVPSSTTFDSSFSSAPVSYSSGSSFYSDPGFSAGLGGSFGSGGVSAHAGANLGTGGGFFGGDLISTALNIVLGLFAFSLILQIVQKVFDAAIFEGLVQEARSMSSDDMVFYTNMAVNAAKKVEEFSRAIPK